MAFQCGYGITKGFGKSCRHDMRTIYITKVSHLQIACP